MVRKMAVVTDNQTIVLSHNTARYLLMHYRQLLQELVKRYSTVVCVTPEDGYHQDFAELGIIYQPLRMSQHGMNPFKEWQVIRQLYKIYKQYQPQTVLNFSIKPCLYGGLAARLAGIKKTACMVTGLGYVFLTNKPAVKLLRWVLSLWYRLMLRDQDILLFQNPDDATFFAKLGISKKCQHIVLPGTGIDTSEFNSKPPAINKRPVRFLFIGRMLQDKGVYELVDACKILQSKRLDFECHLLGPVDSNPSAISLAEIEKWQKEKLIDYLGETTDVKPYIKKADVFVLPSYREGLPRAGLEAMAMSRAVITTDAPGCREIVTSGKNGYIVALKSSEALADAMIKFIKQPKRCTEMGAKSRQYCMDKFEVAKVSAMVMQVLTVDDTRETVVK